MSKHDSVVTREITDAIRSFQRQSAGHVPKAVTVVLNEDSLVITLQKALTPTEPALANRLDGAPGFSSPGVSVNPESTVASEATTEAMVTAATNIQRTTSAKWLEASIRDHAPKDRRLHQSEVQRLEWLVGDWGGAADNTIVNFSCQSADNGNFLICKITILITRQEANRSTQRFGWDPLTDSLRAWTFDTEGGYGEGLWHREADNWVLKSTGVTADGQTYSGKSLYAIVDAQSMTWQSVDQEIGGVQLPDSELVTIFRQAPAS